MGIQRTVKIQLDRIRKLKLDMNGMAAFEETTGLSCLDRTTWEKMNVRTMRVMLWAALLLEEPEITLTDVGKLVTLDNIEYVADKLREAWDKATPDKGESEKGGQCPPLKNSGQSESMISD